MSDYNKNIHTSRSGKDWADFFIETIEKNKPCVFENYKKEEVRETMMAWFCNSMMAMHDSIFNDEIKKLRLENEKLRECVEFYADITRWGKKDEIYYNRICITDCMDYPHITRDLKLTGGGRARQCLKELKERTND